MLVYAGIDEAGYGPMFGPLCVASTVFVLSNRDPGEGAPDLWAMLDDVICRSRREAKQRIAIDDSKKLKGSKNSKSAHPLKHLERGVLSFLRCIKSSDLPPHDKAFLEAIAAETPEAPWYGSVNSLPVGNDEGVLRIDSKRLARTLQQHEVAIESIRCEAVDAATLNRQAAQMGTKAGVNMHRVMKHVAEIWSRWPADHPRIMIDRQGGRIRYREELQTAFPEASIQILAEEPEISRYRLNDGDRFLTVTFLRGGDARHLPIALASMVAKYARELMMIRLNRYFQANIADLKPTAGYVEDGRRFLRDIDPVIKSLQLSRASLVRAV